MDHRYCITCKKWRTAMRKAFRHGEALVQQAVKLLPGGSTPFQPESARDGPSRIGDIQPSKAPTQDCAIPFGSGSAGGSSGCLVWISETTAALHQPTRGSNLARSRARCPCDARSRHCPDPRSSNQQLSGGAVEPGAALICRPTPHGRGVAWVCGDPRATRGHSS